MLQMVIILFHHQYIMDLRILKTLQILCTKSKKRGAVANRGIYAQVYWPMMMVSHLMLFALFCKEGRSISILVVYFCQICKITHSIYS
jgi:hypothetical protein